jgi:hypothetical protein
MDFDFQQFFTKLCIYELSHWNLLTCKQRSFKTDRHDMAEIQLKVALNPIQSISQSNITLLGTDSFISVISAWCWIRKTLVYPFAIITAGALYVSYRHKLRNKHLLKSIHKFSTSYPMNNIPFLEIKLYWKSILALQDVFFKL